MDPELSQRAISEKSGLSLGLTNILLNRLIKKGYLKTVRLKPRRIKYILTPRGIKEKSRKTYAFMRRSLRAVTEIRSLIEDYTLLRYNAGERTFTVIGDGELSNIAELTLKAMNLDIEIYKRESPDEIKGSLLMASPEGFKYTDGINLWAKAEEIYGSSYEL